MIDLVSVLVITFTIGGEIQEREPTYAHATCMAMAAAISTAAPQDRPMWDEMLDGKSYRIETATCVPGCFADAMSDDWDLKPLMEAEGS